GMRVVESALTDTARLVDQLPGRAGIVRTVEAAFVVFDQRINAVGVGTRDGNRHLAVESLRQPAGSRDLPPSVAAVGRFVEAAAGPSARHLGLDAVRLP